MQKSAHFYLSKFLTNNHLKSLGEPWRFQICTITTSAMHHITQSQCLEPWKNSEVSTQ